MTLPTKTTILDAHTIASAMRQAIAADGPLHIDASAVERIDTAILQLLCSLKNTRMAVVIDDPSASFLDTASRCGLTPFLFTETA